MYEGIKFYGSATVGTKGQIVIPAEAREELDIKEGDKLIILRDPITSGLTMLSSKKLEEILGQMRTKLGTMTDSIKNTDE